MKNMLVGALATSSTLLSPLAAYAETEVHFWHAFGGRLGELVAVAGQVIRFSVDPKYMHFFDMESGHRIR